MSRPIKRSFTLEGHRTSVSLEAPFWDALKDIAAEKHLPLASLVRDIDHSRGGAGLSGAIRVFVLDHYRVKATDRSGASQT